MMSRVNPASCSLIILKKDRAEDAEKNTMMLLQVKPAAEESQGPPLDAKQPPHSVFPVSACMPNAKSSDKIPS
jgi:hypothetical protein